MVGTACTVSYCPSIAREPAVLRLRLSITLSIYGSVQCDHVMYIAMAIDKGASGALVGH